MKLQGEEQTSSAVEALKSENSDLQVGNREPTVSELSSLDSATQPVLPKA